MGKFDQALADCNALIEKVPKNQYALTSRADAYIRPRAISMPR